MLNNAVSCDFYTPITQNDSDMAPTKTVGLSFKADLLSILEPGSLTVFTAELTRHFSSLTNDGTDIRQSTDELNPWI